MKKQDRRKDPDIREELVFHLEMRVQENLAAGMTEADARAAAERRLGRSKVEREVDALAKRRARREALRAILISLKEDTRTARRALLREPVLVLVATVTLALGIGANTAMFSTVAGLFLSPLPYADAERLAFVWRMDGERRVTHLSAREFVEYGRTAGSFASLAAYAEVGANLTDGGEPERVRAASVSGEVFATLGIAPQLGRWLDADDDRPGGSDAVVLGHALWERRFGGTPDILGRTIRVNGRALTVVGVMPPEFRLPLEFRGGRASELWVALGIDRADPGPWGARGLVVFGRLRPDVPHSRASVELQEIGRQWTRAGYFHGDQSERLRRQAAPLTEVLYADVRPAVLVVSVTVLFVLLICCVNVANLLLARLEARRFDHATRIALGASRARLVRSLLLESTWLGLAGGIAGVLLAHLFVQVVAALLPAGTAEARHLAIDARALMFAAAVAIGTAILTGLLPGLRAANVQPALLTGSARRSSQSVRPAFRRALVAVQIALSLVLVTGAALLARSFGELVRIDPGFDPDGVIALDVVLPSTSYQTPERIAGFFDQAVHALRESPGVRSAAAARILPLRQPMGTMSLTVEGREFSMQDAPQADWQVVTPGYFETLGIPLIAGRTFTDGDHAGGSPVAVISRAMAERFWPGQDAIGRRFHIGIDAEPWVTVVGIVEAVRHNSLTEPERVEMYVPHAQFFAQAGFVPATMTLLVDGTGEVAASELVRAARERIRGLDATLPIAEVATLDAVVQAARAHPRFLATLVGGFAIAALGLAALGLHALMAWTTARRTSELGVRMALGMDGRSAVGLVLREGMGLAAAGTVVGVPAAILAAQALRSQLYGVSPMEPSILVFAPLVIAAVAAAASAVPALRAARTSPLAALRSE